MPVVGVGAVTIRDGKILLVQRGHAPGKGLWSLPGGRVEWGETLHEALRREMTEETGLIVTVGGMAGLVERISEDQEHHFVILDFFVQVVAGDLRAGGDAAEVRWVLLDEIESLPLVPRLVEALTDFGVIG